MKHQTSCAAIKKRRCKAKMRKKYSIKLIFFIFRVQLISWLNSKYRWIQFLKLCEAAIFFIAWDIRMSRYASSKSIWTKAWLRKPKKHKNKQPEKYHSQNWTNSLNCQSMTNKIQVTMYHLNWHINEYVTDLQELESRKLELKRATIALEKCRIALRIIMNKLNADFIPW